MRVDSTTPFFSVVSDTVLACGFCQVSRSARWPFFLCPRRRELKGSSSTHLPVIVISCLRLPGRCSEAVSVDASSVGHVPKPRLGSSLSSGTHFAQCAFRDGFSCNYAIRSFSHPKPGTEAEF